MPARKLELKNLESRPEQAARYRNTFDTADDRLRVAKFESTPLSEEDAKQLAKDLKEGSFNPDKYGLNTENIIKWSDIAKQSGEAALNALLIGLILKAGPSLATYVISNIKNGELDINELRRIGMDAINDSILNGLRAGIASFLTASCRSGALGESFKRISPVAIGAAVTLSINVMKHSIALSNGQISGSDFADLCLRDTVIVTFSLLGAAAGQILIPIPILGSLIGNFVGGIIANIAYHNGNQMIMSIAIDKGWTFLNFVTQDYTVPEEILKRAGYDLFASQSFSNQSFSTKSFNSQSFSTNSIMITPLKRGIIGVRTVGYL